MNATSESGTPETPTVIARVQRTTGPNFPEFASYAVTTTDGRVYTVRKEFYADGPSLFTWTITSPKVGYLGEAHTKRAALATITGYPTAEDAPSHG